MTFRGLTWDHPRGYDALAAAALRINAGRAEPLLTWDTQPLEGFESAPIADLAARYDLVVLDHPHIGEAVVEDCLVPLETLYPAAQIAQWRAQSVGPALASYCWGGNTYALPLDVANQVLAYRPDRIDTPPVEWREVVALAARLPVALSLAGPHAYLTLISMAAGWGHVAGGADFLSDAVIGRALTIMHKLYSLRPEGSERLNPIGLLEAMARADEIALVPLIFGYVTYAAPGLGRQPVRFAASPEMHERGGVLGGTGIGFSRRAAPSPELLDHLRWLMEPETQAEFLQMHGGQPSARAAWTSNTVNAARGGFYADTLASAESALLRPRFDGVARFQNAAADVIRAALASGEATERTAATIKRIWTKARAGARGSLDDDRGQS